MSLSRLCHVLGQHHPPAQPQNPALANRALVTLVLSGEGLILASPQSFDFFAAVEIQRKRKEILTKDGRLPVLP